MTSPSRLPHVGHPLPIAPAVEQRAAVRWYRGDTLVDSAEAPDFERVTIQTTLIGLAADAMRRRVDRQIPRWPVGVARVMS